MAPRATKKQLLDAIQYLLIQIPDRGMTVDAHFAEAFENLKVLFYSNRPDAFHVENDTAFVVKEECL